MIESKSNPQNTNHPGLKNTKFEKLLNKLQSNYDINPVKRQTNKIYITEKEYEMLSKYEKNVIRSIANIYVFLILFIYRVWLQIHLKG